MLPVNIQIYRVPLNLRKPSYVIKTQKVIRMSMGNQDDIDAPNVILQTLAAQIRRRINQHVMSVQTHQSTGPHPVIAGIGTMTDRTITGDKRNPLTGACA